MRCLYLVAVVFTTFPTFARVILLHLYNDNNNNENNRFNLFFESRKKHFFSVAFFFCCHKKNSSFFFCFMHTTKTLSLSAKKNLVNLSRCISDSFSFQIEFPPLFLRFGAIIMPSNLVEYIVICI